MVKRIAVVALFSSGPALFLVQSVAIRVRSLANTALNVTQPIRLEVQCYDVKLILENVMFEVFIRA